jgi:hypothetical protein
MKHPLLIAVLAATLAGLGCGDKKEEAPVANKTVDRAPPAPSKSTEAKARPKAPPYSPEVADKLIAQLAKCTSRAFCDPYEPLLSFGHQVSAKLVALATSKTAKPGHKRMALTLLKQLADPAAAMPLFAAAKAEKQFIERYDLYEAAAASGGDQVFAAMTAFYDSKAGRDHQLQMRRGLRRFGPKLVRWAAERMKKTRDPVAIADLVSDVAKAGDKDTVLALLKTCKHRMACHRLAATAIRLGEVAQFSVLLDGLRSKDVYDRSDAANFFAKVAKQLPEGKKAEAIALLESGKKRDRGGLTARGYVSSLKALRGR